MAVFAYKAIDGSAGGAALKGTLAAESPRHARDTLRQRGLSVLNLKPVRKTARPSKKHEEVASSHRRRGASEAELVTLLRELSTLLGVGIPLLEALDTLARQHQGRLRSVILTLRDDVAAGESLTSAMRRQGGLFDPLCVSMTEVGEATGNLDEVLSRYAGFRERRRRLKGRIGSALAYPAIVLFVGTAVTIFLMSVVVPQLVHTLEEAGRPLPAPTRIVKGASDALASWWWLMAAGAPALGLLLRAFMRTKRGRLMKDRLLLRLWLVGPVLHKQELVRIAVLLSTLLRSGVPFVAAVRLARGAARNVVIGSALERCEQAVTAGRDLGPALEASRAFPPMVVQIFDVGQRSGRLEEMLDRLADDYDQQVQSASQRLTAILEPIIILLLASVIGLIAMATMLPILEAGDVL